MIPLFRSIAMRTQKKFLSYTTIFSVMSVVFSQTKSCIITEHPKTTVARINETVKLTCEVNADEDDIYIVLDGTMTIRPPPNTDKQAMERGINLSCYLSKCNVSILASIRNNETKLQCGYAGCLTNEAEIIVINEIPNHPGTPTFAVLNATSLNISWSPPWPYPVLYYKLMITSSISNTTVFEETVNTHHTMNKENETECEVIEFAVLAVTNIGNTGFSRKSSRGFPLDISTMNESLHKESIIMYINSTNCGMTSTFGIIGVAPTICAYESLRYEFLVSASSSGENPVMLIPDEGIPKLFFKHIQGTQTYTISERITNEARQVLDFTDIINVSKNSQIINHGNYIKHPRTTVALINTSVEFNCHANDTDDYPTFLKINDKDVTTLNVIEVGIEWKRFSSPDMGFTVSINATHANNGTTIQCFLLPCISEKAELIVVNSPPSAADPPVVTVINPTILNISWTPPWVHPVNFYTLLIYNFTGEQNSHIKYTTTKTFYLFNDQEKFECNELSFSVQADTDVGENLVSNSTIKRFYKGILGIDMINSTKSYKFHHGKEESVTSLHVSFEPPPVCSYEVLTYAFTLTNLRSNEVMTKIITNQSNVEFKFDGNIFPGDELNLVLTVSNVEGRGTINLTMFNAIVFPTSMSTSNPPLNLMIIGIICAIGSFISLLLVLILCCLCFYCYQRYTEKHKVRSDGTRSVSDQIHFTIPKMIQNVQYASAEEVMYETIPTMEEIRALQNGGGCITLSDHKDSAPRLPPPRAFGITSHVNNDNFPYGLTLKEDEYIEMGANPVNCETNLSPRYVQSPAKHGNTTEQSNCKSKGSDELDNFQSIFKGKSMHDVL